MNLLTGILIPFLGTALGAMSVFFMKNRLNSKVEKILLGFASGVMVAASCWSLLIPSIEMAEEQSKIAWLPATIGFCLGMIFLLVLDTIIPHLHLDSNKPEGIKSKLEKTTMMVIAVTLHNIPEGMAVRSCTCRSNFKIIRNHNGWSICVGTRNCNPKLPRRCNNFNAIKSRRNVKE